PTEHLAVGIDARNRSEDLKTLPTEIRRLTKRGIGCELIFLTASDEVLLKRYRESRRRHPLAESGTGLHSTITGERQILSELISSADLTIDTSHTSVYELADAIRERVATRATEELSILIESFGFKNGIPDDADFVFDLRTLPNPYWDPDLRSFNGTDAEVIEFLEAEPEFIAMYDDIVKFLSTWIPKYEAANRRYLTVALGCTGGQHRSVCMVEKVAKTLKGDHDAVMTRHNELVHHSIR
ncbi:MAG: RNase adapter RapZ, partial [Pseudomonadota bacterium]